MNKRKEPNTDLVKYYKARALEYEKIYQKPERQNDILQTKQILQSLFKNLDVFEVGCGTGYWTHSIASSANMVFAIDINPEVLEIAWQKHYKKTQPVFLVADLYTFKPERLYQTMFAGFIWSHIKLQDVDRVIKTWTSFIKPGATLVIMDNIFVQGSNHPITETDKLGNTYQLRQLADGTQHRVLKNFPSEQDIKEQFKNYATQIKYIPLTYFWIAEITLKVD